MTRNMKSILFKNDDSIKIYWDCRRKLLGFKSEWMSFEEKMKLGPCVDEQRQVHLGYKSMETMA